MNAETARLVLFAITAVAMVTWVIGLRFLIRSAKVPGRAGRGQEDRFGPEQPTPKNLVVGNAEVEGQAADLLAKATAALASQAMGALGQFRILQRTDDCVTFEGSGPSHGSKSGGQIIRRGQFQFTPLGGSRTAIDYAIDVSSGRGLLIGGAVAQILGLIAIVVGFLLIYTLVLPNPEPAVRGQVFQMFQVVHFLWPPFLFGGLYRYRHRLVRDGLKTFVHNLPYLDAASQ